MKQPENRGYVRAGQDRRLRRAVPKEISWVAFGLIILVAFHLMTTVIMVLQREAIAAGIRKANPSLSDLQVSYALAVTLVVSALFHAIFVLLYIWLAFKIRTGKPWARTTLAAVLVVATGASAVSFSLSPLFRLFIPLGDVLQLILIGLLWLPASSRAYFAARSHS
jgi:hypothetical protein